MPLGGKKEAARGRWMLDQYSLGNSSAVTLRSHSVMIQSFRSRVT